MNWEAVYKNLMPRIYNFFRYRTGDNQTAEDLTSATFERAWRFRAQYRHDLGEFESWLFGIARNLAVDHLRRNRVQLTTIENHYDLASGENVEHMVETEMDMARMRSLLNLLPDHERELVALKYGAGMTNRDIATVTSLSESNVGTQLYRIIRKLRAEWEEHYVR